MSKNLLSKNLVLIVETNFILDIAFEKSDECGRLLDSIRRNNIKLVIPEYAFAEADGSILDKLGNRLNTIDSALVVLKQASRSAYNALDSSIDQLEQYKNEIEQTELHLVQGKKRELEENSTLIPLTPESMIKAELRGLKKTPPYKQSDRVIYESILEFGKLNYQSGIKILFLTRDKEDFNFDFIKEELNSLNIEIFFSAGECIKRIMELSDTQ
jgi:hypothetical protein